MYRGIFVLLRNIYGHFYLFTNFRGDIDNVLVVWGHITIIEKFRRDIDNWVIV
jgi:hypothetical protein